MHNPLTLADPGTTDAEAGQCYLVSLLVDYHKTEPPLPTDTVARALALTGDDGTHWYIFGLHTGTLHLAHPGDSEAFAEDDVL
jgi:hypothetical protein